MSGMEAFLVRIAELDAAGLATAGFLAKGTLVLAIGAAAALALSDRSARLRHWSWVLAFASLVLLVLATPVLPAWNLPLLPADATPTAAVTAPSDIPGASALDQLEEQTRAGGPSEQADSSAATSSDISGPPQDSPPGGPRVAQPGLLENPARRWATNFGPAWIAVIWIAGVLFLFGRIGVELAALSWLTRTGAELIESGWGRMVSQASEQSGLRRTPRVLINRNVGIPMVWGFRRPVVLLPSATTRWPADRKRIVLLHEFAHARRGDQWTTLLVQLACALHWVNPFVWIAARRLYLERERANDEIVLGTGADRVSYAEHLLEIARGVEPVRRSVSVAMTRPSELKQRIQSVLSYEGKGRPGLSTRAACVSAVLVLAMTIPASMVQMARAAAEAPANAGLLGNAETPLNAEPPPIAEAPPDAEPSRAAFQLAGNGIFVSMRDRIRLFEHDSASGEYRMVWETAPIALDPQFQYGLGDPQLADVDGDGDNELLAADEFGIFVWGDHGRFPDYYPFEDAFYPRRETLLLVADLDGDGTNEVITQNTRRGLRSNTRRIEVWHLSEAGLINLGSIDLAGSTSWTLIAGDPDEDEETEIVSASSVVSMLHWDPETGITEETVIPNVASLIDVVRIADADNDGHDELVVVGNSGRVTVYKPTRPSHLDQALYPVLFQSAPLPSYTQGLAVADIDGDDDNEVLVGVSVRPGLTHPSIVVFENTIQPENERDALRSDFEQVFDMTLDSSRIPGFRVGDTDNDGQNEVVYNSKYVLEFSRDADNRLQANIDQTLVDSRAYGAAIGSFAPAADDTPHGTRLTSSPLHIDAETTDELSLSSLAPGHTHNLWVDVTSDWGNAEDVRVRLDAAENSPVDIENPEVSLGEIRSGEVASNRDNPFVITTPTESEGDSFELVLTIMTGRDVVTRQHHDRARGTDGSRMRFRVVAAPSVSAGTSTLMIRTGDAEYEETDALIDYFDDNYGSRWPTNEVLANYRNLIVLDELSYLVAVYSERLATFVDGGGNAFVHGYDLVGVPEGDTPELDEAREFVADYLHVEPTSETIGANRASGTSGDVIADGLTVTLRTSQYEYLPNVLVPTEGAIPIFHYPSGEVAGIRYEGESKLVHLGFSLNDIESSETRGELLRRILAWFGES